MPIETKHPQWESSIYAWQKSRDAMGGEKIIKSKNTKYLDIPAGMADVKEAPSHGGGGTETLNIGQNKNLAGDDRQYDPTWHPNPAYRAYLRRAKFPDLPAFTVRGLVGLAMKKEFDLEIPKSLEYLEDDFTKDGKTLDEFYKFAIGEVLQTGRLPCIIDIGKDGKMRVVSYSAESNINWKADEFYIFQECFADNDDLFSHDSETVYRAFFIDHMTGIYMSALIEEGATDFVIPDVIPNHMGKTFKKIPIVIIGATNNDDDVDQIPIEGIVDCSIQIYRKTADLSNAQYMSCNPTLVGIGVSDEDKPKALGSTVAWMIGNSEAKAEYLKTDTSALTHIKADINDLFEEAANYGAQLLGSPKRGAESAESIRLQQGAGGATLASVIDTVSQGIESLIGLMAEWSGAAGEISFKGSKEFTDMTLSAPESKELRESWMSGGLSHETYLYNMKRAGVIPEERSVEDELELIELGGATELPDERSLPRLVVDNTEETEDDDGTGAGN